MTMIVKAERDGEGVDVSYGIRRFTLMCLYVCYCLQFDEEFSARQEAQAELQKHEEKIKGLETQINTLQAQVTLTP